MKDKQLRAIRERLANGPQGNIEPTCWDDVTLTWLRSKQGRADADFFKNSVSDMRALLAEVDRLRKKKPKKALAS